MIVRHIRDDFIILFILNLLLWFAFLMNALIEFVVLVSAKDVCNLRGEKPYPEKLK